MSDIESTDWSETAASNNVAAPNGWPEGQLANTFNNCAREMMGALKRDWNRSHPTVYSDGTSETFSIAYATNPTSLVHGQIFSFIANHVSGGNGSSKASLKIGSLNAIPIRKFDGTFDIEPNEIRADSTIEVSYRSLSGTAVFMLHGPQSRYFALAAANAAAPAYTFQSDRTTGLFRKSAGVPAFSAAGTEVWSGSVNGNLQPLQPGFTATISSAVSAVNKITGWTEVFDNGSDFDPTTGRFTAPLTGTYFFMWSFANAASPSDIAKVSLYRNGSVTDYAAQAVVQPYANGCGVVAVNLTASDYVELFVTQGTIHAETTFTRFSGYLLG